MEHGSKEERDKEESRGITLAELAAVPSEDIFKAMSNVNFGLVYLDDDRQLEYPTRFVLRGEEETVPAHATEDTE